MNRTSTNSGPRRRVLNPRAALILLVIVGSAVYGMQRLHNRQFSRTLQFLKDTAVKSLDAKEYRTAQLQFSQYVAMKPSDLEAREKLSWILTEHIRTPQALDQAFRLNEELLRKGHNNDDLRLRQARIAVRLKLMKDADAHLTVLQSSMADNAEVWYLSALTADAARDGAKTLQCLKRSLRCSDKIPEAFELLARTATDESPPEFQADALMAQMITACPTGKAWQIRSDYLMEHDRFSEAIDDLWKALEETPDDLTLNAKLVRCLQATGSNASTPSATEAKRRHLAQAVQHLKTQIERAPRVAAFRLYLAAVHSKNNERSSAISVLEDGIQNMPRAFELHETLIEYLVSGNEHPKARRLLESIPAGAVSRDVYSYCHGRILMAEKRWKEAATALEQTIAFARRNSSLHARAQMSYALCRSRSGESGAALDAYRSVMASSPDSTGARLGIASALVQAGQLDLAIAEYRQLTDVKGVNACMADLMIKKTLQQPSGLRNWDEIDQLLREENPQIPDPVQRLLLRADRLFASGHILQAMNTLENGTARHSDRIELSAALKRMRGELAAGLRERLTQLINEEPNNVETQAVLVRHVLLSDGLAAAMSQLENFSKTQQRSSNDSEQSLLRKIQTLNIVVGLEQKSGRTEFLDALEGSAIETAKQLAALNPNHERQLVRTLVRSGRIDDAMSTLQTASTPRGADQNQPELRAASLLELIRSAGSKRETVFQPVAQMMYSLVNQYPTNVELRLNYAELMLFARQYQIAEETLKPLENVAQQNGRIHSLRAWLRAVSGGDLNEAAALANSAVQTDSQQSAFREVQARVFLSQNKAENALEILRDIAADQRSLAGQVYLVAALLRLDRESEARFEFDRLRPLSETDSLYPADEDLMKATSEQILHPTTALR